MGVLTNALSEVGYGVSRVGAGIGQTVAAGVCYVFGMKSESQKLYGQGQVNLDNGSKTCPIIAECIDIRDGIVCRDSEKAAINGGLLIFHLTPIAFHMAHSHTKIAFISFSALSAEVAEFVGLGSVNEAFKSVFLHNSHHSKEEHAETDEHEHDVSDKSIDYGDPM